MTVAQGFRAEAGYGVLLEIVQPLAGEPRAFFVDVNRQQLIAGHFEGVHDLVGADDRNLMFDGPAAKQNCDNLFCHRSRKRGG